MAVFKTTSTVSMTTEEKLATAIKALEFYANANTYYGIAFFADRPCGNLVDDFSTNDDETFNCFGFLHNDSPMPGDQARSVLTKINNPLNPTVPVSSAPHPKPKWRQLWCWIVYGHHWDKTDSNRMASREMNRCTGCGKYEAGPD